MLKGERAEVYLTPSRERRLVCSLCAPRAQREGWIRESAAPETPTRPKRQSERRRLRGLRLRRREQPEVAQVESSTEQREQEQPAEDGPGDQGLVVDATATTRDLRQVHAVPTNAQLKLDRAVEVFNDSDHPRTVAGIARTLGAPEVSALTSANSAAEVILTVGWELAWYQYAIDLSDAREPVQLRARGEQLDELAEEARRWNAQALDGGRLALGTPDQGAPAEDRDAGARDDL